MQNQSILEFERQVNQLINNKEWQNVINLCDDVINSDTTNNEAYLYRGLAYHHLNNFEKALNDYKKCTYSDTDIKLFSVNKGDELNKEQLENCLNIIHSCTESSDLAEQYMKIINHYIYLKDFKNAFEYCTKAIASINDEKTAFFDYQRGNICLELKNYETAIIDFKNALDGDFWRMESGEEFKCFIKLGNAYLELEQYDLFLENYFECLKNGYICSYVFEQMAKCYNSQEQKELKNGNLKIAEELKK